MCRKQGVGKLAAFKGRITVMAGETDDRELISAPSRPATVCWSCWSLGGDGLRTVRLCLPREVILTQFDQLVLPIRLPG